MNQITNMQSINALPLPQTEPCIDYQLFAGKVAGEHVTYLVYAAKRDYLSVPSTHIIIAYYRYNQQSESVKFLKWRLQDYIKASKSIDLIEKTGFFEKNLLQKYEGRNKNELNRLKEVIFLVGNDLLEIRFTKYEKLATCYHEVNSKSAFRRFLTDNNIDFIGEF